MWTLAESIKATEGVIEPITVRPCTDGEYELVVGWRRYVATGMAGLTQIPCIIRPYSDADVIEASLIENLQREDLNPLEETEGTLKLLCLRTGESTEAIVKMMNQAAHAERTLGDNVIKSETWEKVLAVFNAIGGKPESFRVNRLPLLSLPANLKQAIETGRLDYTKAKTIAKIDNEEDRAALMDKAIVNGLSYRQIEECVSDLKAKFSGVTPEPKKLVDHFRQVFNKLKTHKITDPSKMAKAEKLLAKLEDLLN